MQPKTKAAEFRGALIGVLDPSASPVDLLKAAKQPLLQKRLPQGWVTPRKVASLVKEAPVLEVYGAETLERLLEKVEGIVMFSAGLFNPAIDSEVYRYITRVYNQSYFFFHDDTFAALIWPRKMTSEKDRFLAFSNLISFYWRDNPIASLHDIYSIDNGVSCKLILEKMFFDMGLLDPHGLATKIRQLAEQVDPEERDFMRENPSRERNLFVEALFREFVMDGIGYEILESSRFGLGGLDRLKREKRRPFLYGDAFEKEPIESFNFHYHTTFSRMANEFSPRFARMVEPTYQFHDSVYSDVLELFADYVKKAPMVNFIECVLFLRRLAQRWGLPVPTTCVDGLI